MRLALQKVRSGNITLATLNTIEDLCARTELKITRAIKDVENEREARETATALLTSHTTTTQPTS